MCDYGVMAFIERHGLHKNKSYRATKIFDLEPTNYSVKKVIIYAIKTQVKYPMIPSGAATETALVTTAKKAMASKNPGKVLRTFWNRLMRRQAA